jgi:hypothetical protein
MEDWRCIEPGLVGVVAGSESDVRITFGWADARRGEGEGEEGNARGESIEPVRKEESPFAD